MDRPAGNLPPPIGGRRIHGAAAAAGAALLLRRLVPETGGRGSASDRGAAGLFLGRTGAAGCRLRHDHRPPAERRPRQNLRAPEPAFPPAAERRDAGHHDRRRHRCGALSRLSAGAGGNRGRHQHLGDLRPSPLPVRLPLSAGDPGLAEIRRAGAARPRLIARPARETLRAARAVGAAPGAAPPAR